MTSRSVFWLALALLWVPLLVACESVSTSDRLVTLETFDADVGSNTLRIHGRGIPGGRPCQLTARGTLFVPGEAPSTLKRELSCHAVSEHTLLADLSSMGDEIEGQASFEGELTVSFADQAGKLRLRGVLTKARFRLAGRHADDPRGLLADAQEARAFQRSLGILEVEVRPRGLSLASLTAEGLAARAGLREGDVLVRLDGAPLELASDLRGPSDLERVELTFVRAGQSEMNALVLQLKPPSRLGDPVAVAFLCVLGAGLAVLLPQRASTRGGLASVRGNTARTLAASTLLWGLSACTWGALDVRFLWLAPALAHGLSVFLRYRRGALSGQRVLLHAVDLAAASLAVSALGLLRGSLELPLLDHAGLDEPWAFPLFTTPCAWISAWVLLQPETEPRATALITSPLVDASKLATLLAFTTAPPSTAGLVAMFALAALFSVVSVPILPRSLNVCLALLTVPLGLAADSIAPTKVATVTGPLLAGFLVGCALRAVIRRRDARTSMLDPQLQPFV